MKGEMTPWKYFLMIIAILILSFLIILLVGLQNKNNLENEVSSINNLEDVREFLEECESKIFLNCNLLLKRKLSNTIGRENVK